MKLTNTQWQIVLFLGWMFLIIPFEIIGHLTNKTVLKTLEIIWIIPLIIVGTYVGYCLFKAKWNES